MRTGSGWLNGLRQCSVAEAMASSTADAMIEAIVRAAPRSNEAMLHIGVICQGTREPP